MIQSFNKFLIEASFSRVLQHTRERNIGMISASRGNLPAHENRDRHSELENAVRKAGYGFIHVKGRYVENHGTPQARNVDERSLMVVGKKGDDKGALLGHLKSLGKKFGQDSILHKPHNLNTAQLHGTNATGYPGEGKSVDVGSWHPNKAGEFHSLMRNKKSFAFEDFVFINPKGFFSREEVLF